MATTPDIDLAAVINTAVGALTLGTNLFRGPVRGISQGVPDQAVFVRASGGRPPEAFVAGGTGAEQYWPDLIVHVRSNPHDFAGGQTLARSVRDAVHHNPPAGYVEVEARFSDPVYLGDTDKGHHEWTIGVVMQHEE